MCRGWCLQWEGNNSTAKVSGRTSTVLTSQVDVCVDHHAHTSHGSVLVVVLVATRDVVDRRGCVEVPSTVLRDHGERLQSSLDYPLHMWSENTCGCGKR